MNDQAMTKLASEFYERGRQAALIETGLVKVANKKKTLSALLAGLGIGGSAGVGASAAMRALRPAASKAVTKADDLGPIQAFPVASTPEVLQGPEGVMRAFGVSAPRGARLPVSEPGLPTLLRGPEGMKAFLSPEQRVIQNTFVRSTPSQEDAARKAIEAFAPARGDLSSMGTRGSRLGDALPEAVRGGTARQMARAEKAIADYAPGIGADGALNFAATRLKEVGDDIVSSAQGGNYLATGLRQLLGL